MQEQLISDPTHYPPVEGVDQDGVHPASCPSVPDEVHVGVVIDEVEALE